MAEICVAAALSAIPTAAIVAPSERVKCLLQVQQAAGDAEGGGAAGRTRYTGMVDCARQLHREGGVRSLYRGTGMTLVREVPGTVAYFATYEYVKREIATVRGVDPNGGELSLPAVLVAGGLAGMAYWAIGVTVVADVVKSRYQTAPMGMYAGYADVYRALVRDGGYAGLFRGGRPAILRALPASMTCFLGVELTRKLFEYMD